MPTTVATQVVTVDSGYAYGAVGADIHVMGDGVPAYLLENWGPAPPLDAGPLRDLPSRMLNARFAVVDFTGRAEELSALRRWRDDGGHLAARWLYGPGGAGKSRLAARLAAESAAAGWKVVTAEYGPGGVRPPPGSQILEPRGHAGLLLVVDYADRWPLTHLSWLFDNSLLHRPQLPTRVLLIARTATPWPAIREVLSGDEPETSEQHLEPLPSADASRQEMFAAALAGFARRYGVNPLDVPQPGGLAGDDMGLVLALHTAALVSVDAHLRGAAAPSTVEGLTIYLLDREQAHWSLVQRTPVPVMRRAVFTAALTGTMSRPAGTTVLDRLGVRHIGDVLTDHAMLYPPDPGGEAAVLAPMYPDRLAEDFLALTMPGHQAVYPAQPWAADTATTVLGGGSGTYLRRSIAMLAAATDRWPHLGRDYLYPLLRAEPELAVAAGSAALSALAAVREPDVDVLEAVDALLPAGEDFDLDVGAAALSHALARHRLAAADDDAERAEIHEAGARRLGAAGRYAEALAAAREAVALRDALGDAATHATALNIYGTLLADAGRDEEACVALEQAVAVHRGLETTPSEVDPAALAMTLGNLATTLTVRGADAAALAAATEAESVYGRLAERDAEYRADHAGARSTLSVMLSELGLDDEALPYAAAAADDYRDLAAQRPTAHLPDLAMALHNLGACQSELGLADEARTTTRETVTIRRRLAAANPAVYRPALADALTNLAVISRQVGNLDEALAAATEAVAVQQELAHDDHTTYLASLGDALNILGICQWQARLDRDSLATTERAVAVRRKLAADNPAGHRPDLAKAVNNLSIRLSGLGRSEEALASGEEAVAIWRDLDGLDSNHQYRPLLAGALMNRGVLLAGAGRCADALSAVAEAVRIRRRLARKHPRTRPDLAMALWRYAWVCEKCHAQLPAAVDFAAQAITIYQELAETRPAVFEPLLAVARGTYDDLLRAVEGTP